MNRLRPTMLVAALAVLVAAAAVVSRAAPMLPAQRKVRDEIRCLAGIRRVSLRTNPLPKRLRAVGVTPARLHTIMRDVLKESGLEVAERGTRPMVALTSMLIVDAAMSDTVGVIMMLDVQQNVSLLRMDAQMTLPTATIIDKGLATPDDLRDRAEEVCRNTTNLLVRTLQQADDVTQGANGAR